MRQDDTALVQDEICERNVIGSILTYGQLFDSLSSILDDDCFCNSKCSGIWKAMVSVRGRGGNIDLISVTAEISKSGLPIPTFEVVAIMNETISTADIENHALRLKELSLRRRLWRLGQRLIQSGLAETEDVTAVQQLATQELNGLFDIHKGTATLTDALLTLSDIITRNLSKGSYITGTPTGFSKLDEKGGLQGSDLIIIAGETSSGKSSLALALTLNAIEHGSPVCFYSMEMTKEQLAARLISMKTGIAANAIIYSSKLLPDEVILIDEMKGQLPGDMLFFDDDSTSNIESILMSIRNMKIRHNISGCVIDYLQILSVNSKASQTREQQMGDAARRLKNIAKELGIWVIALSQLSRNSQDPVPSLARLRDSGQIAEAADVVMLIYRPEVYHRNGFPPPFESVPEREVRGKAMIDVAKGRNIGTFQFLTNFDARTTLFTDLQESYDEYEPIEEEAPF